VTDDLALYRDGDGRERVLCPSCGKEFLEVSS